MDFIIICLATYRLTHLMVFDKIFEPIRKLFVLRSPGEMKGQFVLTYELQGGPVRQFFGNVLNCFWCAGIWVAAAIVIAYRLWPDISIWVYYALAAAAVQSLLEQRWVKSVGLQLEMVPRNFDDK